MKWTLGAVVLAAGQAAAWTQMPAPQPLREEHASTLYTNAMSCSTRATSSSSRVSPFNPETELGGLGVRADMCSQVPLVSTAWHLTDIEACEGTGDSRVPDIVINEGDTFHSPSPSSECTWRLDHRFMLHAHDQDIEAIIASTPADKMVALAVRATDKTIDWFRNFQTTLVDCETLTGMTCGRVHKGFKLIAEALVREQRILDKIRAITGGDASWKILITGLSQGGGVSNVIGLEVGSAFTENEIHIVTFGSPRAGDRKFIDALRSVVPTSNMERYATEYKCGNKEGQDVVSTLPPAPESAAEQDLLLEEADLDVLVQAADGDEGVGDWLRAQKKKAEERVASIKDRVQQGARHVRRVVSDELDNVVQRAVAADSPISRAHSWLVGGDYYHAVAHRGIQCPWSCESELPLQVGCHGGYRLPISLFTKTWIERHDAAVSSPSTAAGSDSGAAAIIQAAAGNA